MLLSLLSLTIFIGQTFFIMFVYFEHLTFVNMQNPQAEKVWNALAYSSLVGYTIPYLCVHWIFAMKYWVISNDMQKIEQNQEIKKQSSLEFIYYFVLLINIGICLFLSIAEGFDIQNLINPAFYLFIII